MPGCHSARSVSMVTSSWSSRAAAAGNGSPNAACSRSHQPAPIPQNARPPVSTSSVATALARIPGARKVTGVTRVPSRIPGASPASRPSVTHGSGIGSQARSTCGIWIRWSISAMPSRPASAAAPATAASHPGGSSCQGNREICRTKPSRAGRRSCSAAARREPGECAGSIAAASGRVTRSQPSAPSSAATAGTRRSCPSRTAAGTLRSRCALRRRQSAGSVSNSTATAGSPACLAPSSWARRRAGSSPRVSTTVFRPRFSRAATIWSSRAKASAEASRSCSPLPTTPRNWSEDTTSCGRYLARAQADFPEPDAPTSTTSAGSGSAVVTPFSLHLPLSRASARGASWLRAAVLGARDTATAPGAPYAAFGPGACGATVLRAALRAL